MTVGANSYGTAAGVAALTPRFANGTGTFATTDRPTLAQVEAFIDQVSGIVNSFLSQQGFAVPVTQADVVLSLTMFVQDEVAAIVEGVNNAGRFGPTSKAPGKGGRFAIILEDVKAYIDGNAYGFELLGATRTYNVLDGVAYRDTDNSGDEVAPIFERKAFGNVFKEWDSDE